MKKRVFYTELAYILGVLTLAIGTALMEKGGFGLSMVVAPAYILHLKVSEYLPFFSFGVAEYVFQALLILTMILVMRKVKLYFFFSLVTTVLYGLMLDGCIALLSLAPVEALWARICLYGAGMVICAAGVAFMFRTYLTPSAYELFVKEFSKHFRVSIHRVKTIYDYTSCLLGIVLSFAFFGLWHFEGIRIGTVVCALVNGTIIQIFTKIFEKIWVFEDRFALKKYF